MDTIRSVFREHCLRCTEQRIAIYRTLCGTAGHPTAERLHELVSVQHAAPISVATVYNTLDTLCQVGLARRLTGPDGRTRFDAGMENHLHIHDGERSTLRDVPADLSRRFLDALPRDVLSEIESRLGVSIAHVHVQLEARSSQSNDRDEMVLPNQ